MLFCILLKAEAEVRVAQIEFDRQVEATRLLLEGISSTHVSVLFVTSQELQFLGNRPTNDVMCYGLCATLCNSTYRTEPSQHEFTCIELIVQFWRPCFIS
jgi:hypothetical protein